MASTGRTVPKHITFKIDDSGGTLRTIECVKSINGVGIEYDAADVTCMTEALKNVLPGHGDCTITVVGNFSNTADTGFHTVFSKIVGVNTALSMDIQIGVRSAWDEGEPQFGITSSGTSGMLCKEYTVNPESMECTAVLRVSGATAPAWGTVAET